MKIFQKYQLTIWLSIQNFHSHFTKITHKCEYFGRIVEPCVMYFLGLELTFIMSVVNQKDLFL